MIRLKQDYRGILTNDVLLEAGDYDNLPSELEAHLVKKGFAETIGGFVVPKEVASVIEAYDFEVITNLETGESEVTTINPPVSSTVHVQQVLNNPKLKGKVKG